MVGFYDLPDLLSLFYLGDHNIWHHFLCFVLNLLAVALALLVESFNCSDFWVVVLMPSLCVHRLLN